MGKYMYIPSEMLEIVVDTGNHVAIVEEFVLTGADQGRPENETGKGWSQPYCRGV